MMDYYDSILKEFNIYERIGLSIRMTNHENPISITHDEFLFMKDFILIEKMSRGYEIATAFGVSAVSIGLGMKENNGKLVTMDCYIEEKYNNSRAYLDKREVHHESDGYNSTVDLINFFNLQDVIYPVVGWSPDDTVNKIKEVFPDKLDFVFVDSTHTEDAVIKDIEVIIPLLSDRFALFIHDTHCFGARLDNFLKEKFNRYLIKPNINGYHLGYIYVN